MEMGNLGSKNGSSGRKRIGGNFARGNFSGKGIPAAAFYSDEFKAPSKKQEHYYKSWIAGSLIISHGAIDYPIPPSEMARAAQDMISEAANFARGSQHDVTISPPGKRSSEWKISISSEDDGVFEENCYSSISLDDLVTWSIKWMNIKK